jgi:hypothetical protein
LFADAIIQGEVMPVVDEPDVVAFHAAGKWSKTKLPAFDRNARKMRTGRRNLGSRTEATAAGFNSELQWPGDQWGLWHPRSGPGHDCSLEWKHDDWDLLDRGILKLTDIRIKTTGGVLLEPCTLTWALLEHTDTGVELEYGAVHLDLQNTAKRREANLESCHTLRSHYRSSQRKHPRRRHLLSTDGNRDLRVAHWRRYFDAELLEGTGLHIGWRIPLPKDGTHGRKILDFSAADFPIRSQLLPVSFQPPSDHRPMQSEGRL